MRRNSNCYRVDEEGAREGQMCSVGGRMTEEREELVLCKAVSTHHTP